MKTTLLLASNNRGKLREIQDILSDLDGLSNMINLVRLVSPSDIGIELDVAETGQSYAENAAIKARAFCRAAVDAGHTNLIVLADDSGLEVDALGGAPGLHSARYSPLPNATDADRRQHLLSELKGHARPWPAHFHCTIAMTTPSGVMQYAEGTCSGEIIPEERGSNGFGYDPVFWIPRMGRTMAELGDGPKNQLSHRARALQAGQQTLIRLLNIPGSPLSLA